MNETESRWLLDGHSAYMRFLGSCTQCGKCTPSCNSLIMADMTLGEIARALLAAERSSDSKDDLANNIAEDPRLIQAVRGCFFCTTCKNTCFAHNDVCDLVNHARVDFQNLGLIPRDAWTSVEVDREWDIFTAYRAIYGIYYGDLVRHVANDEHPAEDNCEVAFFPGCSLAAYGPELTREIFSAIEEYGGKTTMIDHCCGSPLKSAGFYDRAIALCDKISGEIEFCGAKRLICVCPGCANAMREALAKNKLDVEVVSLSKFLHDSGHKPKVELDENSLCISKACQDRDGSYVEETCEALGVDLSTPTVFHGCCGAGGAVNAFEPERQASQADSKLAFAKDGSTVVTMCPTCTYTYAYRNMFNPRDIRNKHYSELLFESQFDWDLVFAQLQGMYTGEYGPWLAQVFA